MTAWKLPGVGRITSPYGPRVLAGAVSNFHAGTDLGTKRTPVYAAQDGVVRTIWQTAAGAWVVDLRHADLGGTQIRTRYIHMYRNEITVAVGQRVAAGQRIGTSGASGTSAAHLHFEVMVNGLTVDPVPFMRARGVALGVGAVSNPSGGAGAVPDSPTVTAPQPIQEEQNMLRIAQLKGKPGIYVGDGVTRRLISNTTELADLRWRIDQGHLRGNSTVEVVDRIDWLGKLVK